VLFADTRSVALVSLVSPTPMTGVWQEPLAPGAGIDANQPPELDLDLPR
jgi:hypothetical protein